MTRIYITHCSAKKDDSLKGTGEEVTPDRLYTATPTQRFMQRCKVTGVKWAIFSDKFDVVLPNDKIPWYEKDPDRVTEEDYQGLLRNFVSKLKVYDEIWFYYNPSRFHKLYARLIRDSQAKGLSIVKFTHIDEIR